jgi:5-methylcytosine-specific restriction endonuclease McrA
MRGEPLRQQPKSTPKKPKRRRIVRGSTGLTRAQCIAVVFNRARGRCERCHRPVSFVVWEGAINRAHVNEPRRRSGGADPRNPEHCELLCQGCHMPDGVHTPTAERLRRHLERKDFLR